MMGLVKNEKINDPGMIKWEDWCGPANKRLQKS
jgi:hypothetical protein